MPVRSFRVAKRSVSLLWGCGTCHKQFRTPSRTDKVLTRRCHCPLVFTFGPANPAFLSTTVFRSEAGT